MDPLEARRIAAERAEASRRRYLRTFNDESEPMAQKPIPVNLDSDLREVFNTLPPFSLTFTDLLLIQLARDIDKAQPKENPPSPTPPVAVMEKSAEAAPQAAPAAAEPGA